MAGNFVNPYSANLIGLWDFLNCTETRDTGLDDGTAQDGVLIGDATAAHGWLNLDGDGDRFEVGGDDAPFQLGAGTIITEFTQAGHLGDAPNTVVSRGEADEADDEGFFEIRVTGSGAVEVLHADGGAEALLGTGEGFFEPGDAIKVSYSWSDTDGQQLLVENLTQGTSATDSADVAGLTMDVTDDDDRSFVIGAREADDSEGGDGHEGGGHDGHEGGGHDQHGDEGDEGDDDEGDSHGDEDDSHDEGGGDEGDDDFDRYFNGSVDYLAVLDEAVIGGDAGDGFVDGTAGDDLIDIAYTGDPDGDMIDNGDAILPGETGDDDIVRAGAGDDTVLAGEGDDEVYGDAGDDTLSGGNGTNVLYGGTGDDTFVGGDGADSFAGGAGQDNLDYSGSGAAVQVNLTDGTLSGGDADNDTIIQGIDGVIGSDFDDTLIGFDQSSTNPADTYTNELFGGAGDDYIEGRAGGDLLDGGTGDDTILGGAGDDTIRAGLGDDTVYAGSGDDTVDGGAGDDEIFGGDGSDSVTGGDGNDFIDTRSTTTPPLPDLGFPAYMGFPAVPADPDPFNDRDVVDGGAGDDIILTGDDEDIITGGAGDDTINAGLDRDFIDGGAGDDFIVGGEGSDTIQGGDGDDIIYGGLDPSLPDFLNIPNDGSVGDPDPEVNNGKDVIDGGAGDDIIFGQDDDDTLLGGAGDDYIDGGVDDDTIGGGDGDDTLLGGQGIDTIVGGAGDDLIDGGTGADNLSGGADRDTFVGITQGDVVDGNETFTTDPADDYDTLDLTGSAAAANPGGSLSIAYDPVNPENGVVTYFDAGGAITGTVTFSNIENVIPCFTPGSLIATPKGECRVEDLRVGDRIITRDNGIQEIRWLGRRNLLGTELERHSHLKPVLIRRGALGDGLPERDMLVSPNHRVLVANDKTTLYFEDREVLVAAKHLTGLRGVETASVRQTAYIHFMFDQHEVVLSDGAWSESFQPGDLTLNGIGNAQRNEIFDLFPELKTRNGIDAYQSARRSLKKHEALLLVH